MPGRADIIAHFDLSTVAPEGFLIQVGTHSGKPVAASAGLATLEELRQPGTYEKLRATGTRLMDALREQLGRTGFEAQVVGEPSLFEVVFTHEPIRDYRDVQRGDARLAKRFNELLRARGIFKGDSKYYVSLAHDEDDVRETIAIWTSALDELAHESRRRLQDA